MVLNMFSLVQDVNVSRTVTEVKFKKRDDYRRMLYRESIPFRKKDGIMGELVL